VNGRNTDHASTETDRDMFLNCLFFIVFTNFHCFMNQMWSYAINNDAGHCSMAREYKCDNDQFRFLVFLRL